MQVTGNLPPQSILPTSIGSTSLQPPLPSSSPLCLQSPQAITSIDNEDSTSAHPPPLNSPPPLAKLSTSRPRPALIAAPPPQSPLLAGLDKVLCWSRAPWFWCTTNLLICQLVVWSQSHHFPSLLLLPGQVMCWPLGSRYQCDHHLPNLQLLHKPQLCHYPHLYSLPPSQWLHPHQLSHYPLEPWLQCYLPVPPVICRIPRNDLGKIFLVNVGMKKLTTHSHYNKRCTKKRQ